MQFKIEGLETIPGTDPRVTLHKMADGSTLPMVTPPMRGGQFPEETQAAAVAVRKAANALAELDAARRAAANDKTLSDLGRAEKVKGPMEAAQRALSEADAQLAQIEASTATLHDQAFAPPVLETADVNGALIDQEIRAHARGLTSEERTGYLKTLKSNPRHLEAIMRSPVPIPHAARLWNEAL